MLSNGKMSVSVVNSAALEVTDNPERAGSDFDNYSPKTFIDAVTRAGNDRDFARSPTLERGRARTGTLPWSSLFQPLTDSFGILTEVQNRGNNNSVRD